MEEKPLEIEGIQVRVEWSKFTVGSSFFVPCISSRDFRHQLYMHARARKIRIKTLTYIENGLWGIRIWRMA